MSVVSERSATARRSGQRQRPRPLGGRARGYSHSDIGGPTDQLLFPHFSAIANEGLKRPAIPEEWGENTTMLTGNTSEHSFNGEENKAIDIPVGTAVVRRCSRMLWLLIATIVCLIAFVSAPAMVSIPLVLHYLRKDEWPAVVCELDCQGNLFDLSFKTVFLVIAQLAMYYRRATADLPRLYVARAAITLLVLFELFGFWLFYVVRILLEKESKYVYITSFANSLINALLFTHYLSLIVLELRKHRPEFVISIVRDPDGETRTCTIGKMSVQEAAIEVLRFYHAHFPSYNVYYDKARIAAGRMKGGNHGNPGITYYDIEGLGGHDTISEANTRAIIEALGRRRQNNGYSELLHREQEWEGRTLKRRARLQVAAEDAFSQVQPVHPHHNGPKLGEMNVHDAANSVYSWVAKPLAKYLKLTRQQERNTAEDVKDHIERCLAMKLSHRTFMQRFTANRFPQKAQVGESKWSLSCGWPASAPSSHNVSFVLKCHDRLDDVGVQLVCTISALPFFNLTEQSAVAPHKFTLRVSHDAVV